MEFLKNLFGAEPLTYEQFAAKVAEAKIKPVDISGGAYVSKEKFDSKVTALNGQISELQGQVSKRDTDLTDLNARLTAAQTDAGKLADAQSALAALQSSYATEKAAYEQRIDAQAYEFAVRERANALKFSSGAAKKAFIADAMGKKFAREGDNLLGFDDFVTAYKASDPGTFVQDAPPAPPAPPTPAPTITLPAGGATPPKKMSLMEMMRQKNANPSMVIDFAKK